MTCEPFGYWPSHFSADNVAAAAQPINEIRYHNGFLYWLTRLPHEGGRQVIMQHCIKSNSTNCLTPAPWSARSRVHEYGGGVYAIGQDTLFFVNDKDQRIYQQSLQQPEQITPITTATEKRNTRFGDLSLEPKGKWLIAVREQHTADQVINDLVIIDTQTHKLSIISSGDDFYAAPTVAADSSQIAYLSWSLPHMPWESTKLWQQDTNPSSTQPAQQIAGSANESIYQPSFASTGELFAISDKNNWWNLYQFSPKQKNIHNTNVDCGYPLWVLGTNQYALYNDKCAWLISGPPGAQQLQHITPNKVEPIELPISDFVPTITTNDNGESVFFVGGNAQTADTLYHYHHPTKSLTTIATSVSEKTPKKYFSQPEIITIETDSLPISGFFYPPHNPDITPANNCLPPLIVFCHGGPNGASTTQCNYKIQFWTSRGFAVLDVNYRGSTGYGRKFRQALNAQWGVADVADCCAMAKYLVDQQKVNEQQLFIRGQSSGGLTTLAALVQTNLFAAGTSCYGVTDLTLLLDDTHKFESEYLTTLVGPYPQAAQTYHDRSPANHLEQLQAPVLFLQGADDNVVPPQQTKRLLATLQEQQKTYQYVEFPDEGHGFRQAKHIIKALTTELEFYQNALGKTISE